MMHVICTAGHVDHGKSTLVEALTTMQPDRFVEEQQRGLTIDLGFAWFDLDDEHTVAFVDLPGHERFIGNMLAGAGPIEIALLVVAANEGWMPQSREHLQILDLLGVRHGVVALTKIDTVDDELAELAELEVLEALEGTSLEGATIVRTSAQTGLDLDALRDALRDVCDRVGAAADRGRPRLWIDRAFTIRGAGTVVTGTLGGGTLRTGDELAVLPGGARGRARSLQSLDIDRDAVPPGSRVAVNLAGVDREEAARGRALVRPDQWRSTRAFDAWVRVLPGHRVRHTGAWHVHIGSAEHVARVWPLAGRQIVGPAEGPVHIELRGAVAVEAGDRFVLREVGRAVTVGGGPVLDAAPPRRPRGAARRHARAEQLAARAAAVGDRDRLLALHVAERGAAPVLEAHALIGVAPADPPAGVHVLGDHYVDDSHLRLWSEVIRDALAIHHVDQPLARTAPRPVVDNAVLERGCPAAVVDAVVTWCERQQLIVREAAGLRLPDHRVALDDDQRRARDELLAALDANPFAPPGLADAAASAGVSRPLLAEMESAGQLVRLAGDIAMTSTALEQAMSLLRDAATDGPLTASEARQVLGTSRKYILPLLEELDRRGITRRSGDTRTFA
ncbi:MAG TPA: selenocysteine-specific translation elongation factor [Euzebyales bacterium]